MIFCAYLFNLCPGLVPTEEEKYAAAELIDDDVEGTREERCKWKIYLLAFRMWNNSLGIEGVYLNNLYNDIVDGIPLLKTLEKVEPGCVDWKKVEKNPSNKFKKLTNCNLAVNIGR
jgi:plastin-1